ncbi:MAG: DUF6242 domain-containing protein [Candidatus Symbiothrix sp.]|nr:DUF6242 domain-containing protein [Candidatus Symbiothrix sp.]
MFLRKSFIAICSILMAVSLYSCLGNDDEFDDPIYTDAQIISLTFSHSDISELGETVFSIDQTKGAIYNLDSLPFLTVLPDSVLLTYSTGTGTGQSLQIIAGADSIWKESGDSIHLENNLLEFICYAPNGESQHYTVQVNIHQTDPDMVNYQQLDLADYPFPTLPDAGNDTLLIRSDFGSRWTYVKDLQHVWASEDGSYWVNLANTQAPLPEITDGIAFCYNNEIWLMGGNIVGGSDNFTIYYSQDGGLVWKSKSETTNAPIAFDATNAAINVDDEGKYFYIVKGSEIWKAAINSQLFDR